MSPQELSRLERVEKFISRLTLNSYLAKAADGSGERVLSNPHTRDAAEQRLASAATYADDLDDQDHQLSVLNDLRERIKQLENLWRVVIEPTLGNKTSSPVQQGEAVLAKAAEAYQDADGLMALGEREISDPTQMGIFAGHLAANDLNAARDVLIDVRERGHVAKAADAAQQVDRAFGGGLDDDLAGFDSRAATSELTARFSSMERLLASLETRLSAIERRPQAAAPVDVDDEQLVAKAAAPKRKRTKEETADYLMSQVDAYCDSPTVVGQLSSMIQAGQFKEVRVALTSAKRAHESARLSHERKSWS